MGKLRPGWWLCDLGRQAQGRPPHGVHWAQPWLTCGQKEHPQWHCQLESEVASLVCSALCSASPDGLDSEGWGRGGLSPGRKGRWWVGADQRALRGWRERGRRSRCPNGVLRGLALREDQAGRRGEVWGASWERGRKGGGGKGGSFTGCEALSHTFAF